VLNWTHLQHTFELETTQLT